MTPFKLLNGDWLQITPKGDFHHELGIQRLDEQSIGKMVGLFNSTLSRMARFFSGVPVFIGHPDNPTLAEKYPDTAAYGWITELDDRKADGLWGRVKWSTKGQELINEAHFKFVSPNWRAAPAGNERGRTVYRPEKILSVGLTNTPNLPNIPLSNDQDDMKKLSDILGMTEESTPDQICEKVQSMANEVQNAKDAAASERTARIDLILSNAITGNKITIAQRAEWEGKLSQDFDAAVKELANVNTPALNTQSQTQDLGNKRPNYDTPAKRSAELQAYLQEKMVTGLSHTDAWQLAKMERRDLFEQMSRK